MSSAINAFGANPHQESVTGGRRPSAIEMMNQDYSLWPSFPRRRESRQASAPDSRTLPQYCSVPCVFLSELDSRLRGNDEASVAASLRMQSFSAFGVKGFTLLEMLLVVFLMGMLAVAATAMVDNAEEQQRFELTRSRLQQIRYAIIGDISRTMNGEPVISGFVADMGRLPKDIQELVELGSQPVWQPIDLSGVTPGMTGQIWGGWRGPYLEAMPELGGNSTFRDGWELSVSSVLPNYGWHVVLSGVAPDYTDINVQSLGADGALGGTGFDADFPGAVAGNLVGSAHWQTGDTAITFNIIFNKSPLSDQSNLVLKLYSFEDDSNASNAIKDSVISETSISSFGLSAVSASPHTETVSVAPASRPMGRYAVVVWCSDVNVVYDGDCTSGNAKLPYYFTLMPNIPLPITINVPWNIQ